MLATEIAGWLRSLVLRISPERVSMALVRRTIVWMSCIPFAGSSADFVDPQPRGSA